MFILAPILLSGCAETCALPQSELNQKVWSVFVQPVTYTIDGEEDFPAESSPGNGPHEMIVDWATNDPKSAIVVQIDGQSFDGSGTWSTQECGNFSMSFSGTYEVPDGATHAFGAGATMVTYPGHLDGFLNWNETWRSATGAIGDYVAEAQMFGVPESEAGSR